MGFFNRNSGKLGIHNAANIVANESYYGECGALRITLEALQNEGAIFNAMMESTFDEAGAIQEGATEEQIEALQEGAIGSFVTKIKEIVKKIAEKIKGLFQSFIVKVNSVIIRDNKKFVDKYKRDVLTKDTSKMKFKWSKPQNDGYISVDKAYTEIEKHIDKARDCVDVKEFEKVEEDIDEKYPEDFLKGVMGGKVTTDESSFAKDYHEFRFEDEEEKDGLDSSLKSDIIATLINSKDALKTIEKLKTDTEKVFTKYLNMIDKKIGHMSKSIPDGDGYSDTKYKAGNGEYDGIDVSAREGDTNKRRIGYSDKKDKGQKDTVMKQLVLIQKCVTKSQSLFSTVASAEVAATKFEIAQARRVFAKAAAFNPKSVKESALFEAAAEEASDYEIMSSFESPEMA